MIAVSFCFRRLYPDWSVTLNDGGGDPGLTPYRRPHQGGPTDFSILHALGWHMEVTTGSGDPTVTDACITLHFGPRFSKPCEASFTFLSRRSLESGELSVRVAVTPILYRFNKK